MSRGIWLTVFLCGALGFPAASFAATEKIVTNDTFASRQWYLDAIHAREGWTMTTGTRDVVVAIVDSGVDIDHEDLKGNIWINPSEIAGNKKDDDKDGYIDDVHGWNFVTNTPDVHPTSTADGIEEAWIHGTAVASLIGAVGNNGVGMAGVAWRVRLMPLVVLDADGYGKDDQLIGAIRFAVAHGADVINLSLVGYDYDAALADAIHEATAQGVFVVSAAGNVDVPEGEDMDKRPGYPACNKGAASLGELTVGAIDAKDVHVPKTNIGSCVDVSAPGGGIFAARPAHDRRNIKKIVAGYVDDLNGSSVAAPLVSGLGALLKAEHPSWRGPQIAQRILDTVDPIDRANPTLVGKLGKGKINVARALAMDTSAARLGPLSIEGASPGNQPVVRVKEASGKIVAQFAVGPTGDTRGVRAAFVRWQGKLDPDVIVTMIGDRYGAWHVYRLDGLLIAAGTLGSDLAGGAVMATEDIDLRGQDAVLFGEANGQRSWIVTPSQTTARLFYAFSTTGTMGIMPVHMTRPTSAFLLGTAKGDAQVTVIGAGPRRLMGGIIAAFRGNAAYRTVREGVRVGDSAVYQFQGDTKTVTLIGTAQGTSETAKPVSVSWWSSIPSGEQREPGWWWYQVWPR